MKQITVILLLCIYSLSTYGVALKEFYCCGKLKSVSVAIADHGAKDGCGKDDENSECCKTKLQFFKVKDKHVAATDVTTPAKHVADLHFFTPFNHEVSFVSHQRTIPNTANGPPPKCPVPIYIFNCVFKV